MSWHVGPELLARYRDGQLPVSAAWSVEAHLGECARCRAQLAGDAPAVAVPGSDDRLETIWAGIEQRALTPPVTALERGLRAVGVGAALARLTALAPGVRGPWLLAVVAVGAAAVGAAHLSLAANADAVVPFLVSAPVVAAVAVALSHSATVSPLHEIERVAPIDRATLLVARSVTVLGGALLVLVATALALPPVGWLAAAWLLPALAAATVTLALLTWQPPPVAAATTTLLWLATVAAVRIAATSALVAFGGAAQLVCLVVLLAAATVRVRAGAGGLG